MDKNRNIVITGGGSGIGFAITRQFLENGDHVHVLEIDNTTAEKNLSKLEGKLTTYSCDVANAANVKQVVDQIIKNKEIDVLINNAGIAHIGNVENTSEEDLNRLYEVNIKGVYNCVHTIIPYMRKNKQGTIINIASVAASVGIADRFAYSMTKGAVLTMTYSVAKDYLPYNIRCNAVSPARVHTPFVDGYLAQHYPDKTKQMFDQLSNTQPIGRMGKPAEVAALVYFLCSEAAAFITGTNFPVDGGFLKLNT